MAIDREGFTPEEIAIIEALIQGWVDAIESLRVRAARLRGSDLYEEVRVNQLLTQAEAQITALRDASYQWAQGTLEKSWRTGQADIEISLPPDFDPKKLTVEGRATFNKLANRQFLAVVSNTERSFDQIATTIGRWHDDGIREVQLEVERTRITAGLDQRQTVETVDNLLTEKFGTPAMQKAVDPLNYRDLRMPSGWRGSYDSYIRMVARTNMAQSRREGGVMRMLSNGIITGRVTSYGTDCPVCRPWEGALVSLVPDHPKGLPYYRDIFHSRATSLFHPNCGHQIQPWVGDLEGKKAEKEATKKTDAAVTELRKKEAELKARDEKRRAANQQNESAAA